MKINILALLIFVPFFCFSQKVKQKKLTQIEWYSFEKGAEKQEKTKKKMFIDIYTTWCVWCSRMDAVTFHDKSIETIFNKYFIAVKLDAERKDTVKYNGRIFVNPNPDKMRSPHQLAASLLNNKMGYPSFVILDENMRIIHTMSGYMKPEEIEPILEFIGSNEYSKPGSNYEVFKNKYLENKSKK